MPLETPTNANNARVPPYNVWMNNYKTNLSRGSLVLKRVRPFSK